MAVELTSRMYEEKSRMKSFRFLEKRVWESFLKDGHTNHSASAMLLPVILNRCERERIPYTLKALPGAGYYIERDKAAEEVMSRMRGQYA